MEDRLELRFPAFKQAGDVTIRGACQREALTVQGEDAGNLFSRCDHIDAVGSKSAVWHIGKVRGSDILGKGEASLGFDGLRAARAVRTSAGENDAEGKEGGILCQGRQEGINGVGLSPRFHAWMEVEDALGNGERPLWGKDIDMIRLHEHAILGLVDRHHRDPGQQFRKRACGVRIEMLQKDIREPKCGRKSAEQIQHGLQSTGGGTNPYYLGSSTYGCVGVVEFHFPLFFEDTCHRRVRASFIRGRTDVSKSSRSETWGEAYAQRRWFAHTERREKAQKRQNHEEYTRYSSKCTANIQ